MNVDFHYYGTYTAARVVGFRHNEAVVIAHAAQYVDDSDQAKIVTFTDFVSTPTVHTHSEILKIFATKKVQEARQHEIARVWSCFHFLPGNYENDIKKAHTGVKKHETFIPFKPIKWEFNGKATEQFKLMCLPNNEIVKEMVNDVTIHKLKEHFLELLGIRMHVLADTWAHMYHVGISAWFINEAYDVKEANGNIPNWLCDPLFNDSLTLNKCTCTPRALYYNSWPYLGHGRMGHFPDYGFKHYFYRPCWSNSMVEKNNPEHFLNAFKQMVKAMQCIMGGENFNNGFAELNTAVETIVKDVIATKAIDQTAAWKDAIKKLKAKALIEDDGNELPNYDANKWINEYKNKQSSDSKRDSSYYKFNMAASLHVNLVETVLARNKIYLPKEL